MDLNLFVMQWHHAYALGRRLTMDSIGGQPAARALARPLVGVAFLVAAPGLAHEGLSRGCALARHAASVAPAPSHPLQRIILPQHPPRPAAAHPSPHRPARK